MPIGGFVITAAPDRVDAVTGLLEGLDGVDVHGVDSGGNFVAVIETTTSDEMDALVLSLEKDDDILTVGLTYLNAEDEIEKIERGELEPGAPFGRKGRRSGDAPS